MKRTIGLLLIGVMVMTALTGCGDKDKEKDKDAAVPDRWTGDYAQTLLLSAPALSDAAAGSVSTEGRYASIDEETALIAMVESGLHLYVKSEAVLQMDDGNITFVTSIGEGAFYVKTQNGKGVVRFVSYSDCKPKTVYESGDIRQIFLTGNTLNIVNVGSGKLEQANIYALLDGEKPKAVLDLPSQDTGLRLTLLYGHYYYLKDDAVWAIPVTGGEEAKIAENVTAYAAGGDYLYYAGSGGLYARRLAADIRFPGEPEDDISVAYKLQAPSTVGGDELLSSAGLLIANEYGRLYFHSNGNLCYVEFDQSTDPYDSDGQQSVNIPITMIFNKNKSDDPLPGRVVSLHLFGGNFFAYLACDNAPAPGYYWSEYETISDINASVLPPLTLSREDFVCAAGSNFTISVAAEDLMPGEKIKGWTTFISGKADYEQNGLTAKITTDTWNGAAAIAVNTSLGRSARCNYILVDPNSPDDLIKQYEVQTGLTPVANTALQRPTIQTLSYANTAPNIVLLNNELNPYDEGRGYEDYKYVEILRLATITVEPTDIEMEKGDTQLLVANTAPRYLAHLVQWESNDLSVAYPMIGSTGGGASQVGIRAMQSGTATITARLFDSTRATCAVSVKRTRSDSIQLPANEAMAMGSSRTLTATLTPDNSNDIVRWRSEDDSIVSLTSRGGAEATLTAYKEGEVYVTATIENGKQAKCLITVRKEWKGTSFTCSTQASVQGFHNEVWEPCHLFDEDTAYYPTRDFNYVIELTQELDMQVEQWAVSAVIDGWYFIFDSLYIDTDNDLRFNPTYRSDTGINPSTFMPGDKCVIHLTFGGYMYPSGGTYVYFRYYDKNGVFKFTYPGYVYFCAPDKNNRLPHQFPTRYATERTLFTPGVSVWQPPGWHLGVSSATPAIPYATPYAYWQDYDEWDFSDYLDDFLK